MIVEILIVTIVVGLIFYALDRNAQDRGHRIVIACGMSLMVLMTLTIWALIMEWIP